MPQLRNVVHRRVPRQKAPPDAIEPTPFVLPAPPPSEPDTDAPPPRRKRRLDFDSMPLKAAPSRVKPLLIVLGIVGAGIVVVIGIVAVAGRRIDDKKLHFGNGPPIPNAPGFHNVPPVADVPDRILTAAEQKQQAKVFFEYFSGVMRLQNNAAETGAFDATRLLDAMFNQKLIPIAWRNDQDGLTGNLRQAILNTSIYRGEHWKDFRVSTVQQPRPRELIVVTRHPNPITATALRLRWWLVHRDGVWRIEDMEDIDFGVRLSLLVAADVQPFNPGAAFIHPDLRLVRDAANAIMIRVNFDEADRILRPVRVAELPAAAAGTYHMLMATVRDRQNRFEDALTSCDLAHRLQPDLPGADFLRALALNSLRRGEPALKHARLAREWLGDEPEVCYELGLAEQNLHHFVEAAGHFRKTLDEQSNHKDALFNLARCFGPGVKGDDFAARFLKMKDPQGQFESLAQDRWAQRDVVTLELLAEAMRTWSCATPTPIFTWRWPTPINAASARCWRHSGSPTIPSR